MDKDILMLRARELKRLQVMGKVIEGELKQKEAGEILRLSERQVRRIKRRIKDEGEKGVIHRLRGKPSTHRIAEEIRGRVVELYRKKYEGFGPLLASEKMLERDRLRCVMRRCGYG